MNDKGIAFILARRGSKGLKRKIYSCWEKDL